MNESLVTTSNLLTHLEHDKVQKGEASISQASFPPNLWENRLDKGRQ